MEGKGKKRNTWANTDVLVLFVELVASSRIFYFTINDDDGHFLTANMMKAYHELRIRMNSVLCKTTQDKHSINIPSCLLVSSLTFFFQKFF